MKYKIGDKVRVRKDLVPNSEYGGVCYVEFMDKFKDKECVITNMDDTSYRINNSEFWWTDEMLEPVDNEGALLEYALEKLGMTKGELENEMNRDEEDITFVEKCMNNKNEIREYCKKFNSTCNGCEVKRFKDKYKDKFKYQIDISCDDVYRYLKEKGEI